MKRWCALIGVALAATTSAVVWADPLPSATEDDPPPKRPLPDYGGQPAIPNSARDAVLWLPRLVLSPAYLVSEYLFRAPLSIVLPAAERAELPRKGRDLFLFAPDYKGGILPVAYADFGFNPSVGVYGFWHDAFAKENNWSAHAEAWPTDWYAASLKESVRLDRDRIVRVQVSGMHRPDRVFYGIGPRTLESSQSRYTDALADESVMLDWKWWRESRIQLTVGLRSDDTGPGHYGRDPSLEREAATGAFAIPYGFGGRYAAEYNRVLVSIDSREATPASGSGLRIETKAEQGSDMTSWPASGWIRYGVVAGGFVDLDGYRHVLSLSAGATFADPLGSRPIPFTELVALGGEGPMYGYFPRRLVDRSALVAALRYAWPVGPGLGGTVDVAIGNVFDQHLQGFNPSLLRVSSDVGLSTTGARDYPIEAVIGIGSETFEHGGQIDSVRVKLSVNHGF